MKSTLILAVLFVAPAMGHENVNPMERFIQASPESERSTFTALLTGLCPERLKWDAVHDFYTVRDGRTSFWLFNRPNELWMATQSSDRSNGSYLLLDRPFGARVEGYQALVLYALSRARGNLKAYPENSQAKDLDAFIQKMQGQVKSGDVPVAFLPAKGSFEDLQASYFRAPYLLLEPDFEKLFLEKPDAVTGHLLQRLDYFDRRAQEPARGPIQDEIQSYQRIAQYYRFLPETAKREIAEIQDPLKAMENGPDAAPWKGYLGRLRDENLGLREKFAQYAEQTVPRLKPGEMHKPFELLLLPWARYLDEKMPLLVIANSKAEKGILSRLELEKLRPIYEDFMAYYRGSQQVLDAMGEHYGPQSKGPSSGNARKKWEEVDGQLISLFGHLWAGKNFLRRVQEEPRLGGSAYVTQSAALTWLQEDPEGQDFAWRFRKRYCSEEDKPKTRGEPPRIPGVRPFDVSSGHRPLVVDLQELTLREREAGRQAGIIHGTPGLDHAVPPKVHQARSN